MEWLLALACTGMGIIFGACVAMFFAERHVTMDEHPHHEEHR